MRRMAEYAHFRGAAEFVPAGYDVSSAEIVFGSDNAGYRSALHQYKHHGQKSRYVQIRFLPANSYLGVVF